MAAQEQTTSALNTVTKLAKHWGHNTVNTARATVNYWWKKYEEFVGLDEVQDAQSKVADVSFFFLLISLIRPSVNNPDSVLMLCDQAEKAFMVARGVVREAHLSLEALEVKLKEVRDRLDRVSREEAHYLELATLEHRLLQVG